jgi:myosin heavy subunit
MVCLGFIYVNSRPDGSSLLACFVTNKGAALQRHGGAFGVRHYAGVVHYATAALAEKNKERVLPG